MNMKRIALALMMVFTLSFATRAYAQDNGTEFVVTDDLVVNGATGTSADPDFDVAGYSQFPSAAQIQIIDGSGANSGKVLVSDANGQLYWSSGGGKLTESLTNLYLPVWDSANGKFLSSSFYQAILSGNTLVTLTDEVDFLATGKVTLGDGGNDIILDATSNTLNVDAATIDLTSTADTSLSAVNVVGTASGFINLTSTGNTSINAVDIVGTATGNLDLNVSGDTSLNAVNLDLNLSGDTSLNGVNVVGTLSGFVDLNVTGDTSLSATNGVVDLGGFLDLNVTGDTSLNTAMLDLNVTNDTSLNAANIYTQAVTVNKMGGGNSTLTLTNDGDAALIGNDNVTVVATTEGITIEPLVTDKKVTVRNAATATGNTTIMEVSSNLGIIAMFRNK